ncbi:hypothetical protein R69746_07736 [Paraburkholderia aspalathi]|nr:hypothetical protein R69746_07736 [Paraburkholderia aspalathi]
MGRLPLTLYSLKSLFVHPCVFKGMEGAAFDTTTGFQLVRRFACQRTANDLVSLGFPCFFCNAHGKALSGAGIADDDMQSARARNALDGGTLFVGNRVILRGNTLQFPPIYAVRLARCQCLRTADHAAFNFDHSTGRVFRRNCARAVALFWLHLHQIRRGFQLRHEGRELLRIINIAVHLAGHVAPIKDGVRARDVLQNYCRILGDLRRHIGPRLVELDALGFDGPVNVAGVGQLAAPLHSGNGGAKVDCRALPKHFAGIVCIAPLHRLFGLPLLRHVTIPPAFGLDRMAALLQLVGA